MRVCRLMLLPAVIFTGLLLAPLFLSPLHAETWYVRADGAPHASEGLAKLAWRGLDPKHTCDGHHDAAWPAPGSKNALGATSNGRNQPCALSDWRWLYDDQGSYGKLNWLIKGGDTVILDNTKPWRVGIEGPNGTNGGEPWCWGWEGGPYGCFNPVVPSGTAQQHTRILGRNWASCSAGNQPDKSKMSQIFGGHGVSVVLNLAQAKFVDVQCLEITRHSQCVTHGDDPNQKGCNKSVPLDDYDNNGMWTDAGTHDLLLQDIWDHGHTERGLIGPIGGLVTANRVDISTNGMAGWDLDDGRSTASVNAVLKMNYSTIEWSGCDQEYPATHPNPVIACFGQSNAGYGDGLGTPSNSGMDVFIDHSVFRYNVQEGLDLLHIDVGTHSLRVTNSESYGNGGQAFKWGGNMTDVLFANNVAIGNCLRMSKPMAGTPASFNAHLGDFCRAGDTLRFNFRQGGKARLVNNTIVSYSPTIVDWGCSDPSCSQSTFVFRNNIVLGYDNPGTYSLGGKGGGPGGFYTEGPAIGHIDRGNNLFYGLRNVSCGGSEICKDPQLMRQPRFRQESDLDHFNVHPAPTSPAHRGGARIAEVPTDLEGKPRPGAGNYTIGAVE